MRSKTNNLEKLASFKYRYIFKAPFQRGYIGWIRERDTRDRVQLVSSNYNSET